MPQFTAGFLNGEITDSFRNVWMTAEELEEHFSVGTVYVLNEEPQGMQWRVLQRRGPDLPTQYGRMYMHAQLLPMKEENIPNLVRMAALVS